MTTLTVGANQQYTTIAAAVAATQDGDTVLIQAGTYVNDFFTTYHKITLQSQGGLAVIQAAAAPSNGKGIITEENDLTIIGLGFTGAAVADQNGAGIRYEAGNLTIQNSVFWNNQDGILATPLAAGTGTISISGSEFSHNGAGDGYSHNIYIGAVASLTVDNSYFHDAVVGHELKSRALATTITNSRIQDNAGGTASYDVDLPNGGVALLQNDVIEKGANATNVFSVHFGGEGTPYANSSLTIQNSTLIDDNSNGYAILNQAGVTATGSNNSLYNYAGAHLAIGPVAFSGTTTLATEPALNGTTMVPGASVAVPVTDASTGTSLPGFGVAGAVGASGRYLTVGVLASGGGRNAYATLQQALDASRDGDTIQVAAGTYTDSYADISHKVIIQGVGGVARFVQSASGSRAGLFVANTDVTIQNVDISGARNGSGSEAGLYVAAGNVTLVNSTIHDSNTGLVAASNAASNVGVYGSDFVHNGNASTRNPIQINAINSFILKNSLVTAGVSGHEIASLAYNTDIEDSRVIDGGASTASFLIDLGAGGRDTVRNNLLVKGANAANGVLVHVGGEAAPYANSAATITGNTFVSQLVNAAHPSTYFIVGDGAMGLPPVSASGNSFAGGAGGSVWLTAATDAGGNAAAAVPAGISTATATSAAGIPAGFAGALFDATYYLAHNPDVAAAGADPYQHYLLYGWHEGRNPSALFDTNYYLTQNPDVRAAAVNPLLHFEQYGWKEGRQPSLTFDDAKYTAANPGVAGTDPLLAYMQSAPGTTTAYPSGGTAPADPLVNAVYYDKQLGASLIPAGTAGAQQAAWSYDATGWQKGLNPNSWFDTNYYLSHNPDVAAAHVDPLLHYELYGWKEGRDPSALFSTNKYLTANPDVKAAAVDPLLHYVVYGQTEGRPIYPS